MSRTPQELTPSSLSRPRTGLTQEQRVEALILELAESTSKKVAVNVSLPSHVVITRALHALVLGGRARDRAKVRLSYNDRSHGRLFPVGRLISGPVQWSDDGPIVRVGTLSFRHLDYDDEVDLYLIRDKETRRLRQAEIERLAFQRMTEVLRSRLLAGAGRVELYQTGLEPIVVGALGAFEKVLWDRSSQGVPSPMLRSIFYIRPDGKRKYGPVWGGTPEQ